VRNCIKIGHPIQEALTQIEQIILDGKTHNPGKKISNKEVRAKFVESDLGKKYEDATMTQQLLEAMFGVDSVVDKTIEQAEEKLMYIPQIVTKDFGEETYHISSFNLDFTDLVYVPIRDINLIKKSLTDNSQVIIEKDGGFILTTEKPEKILIDAIRKVSEIDYEKATATIQNVVMQFLSHYRAQFSEDDVVNICTMFIKDITSKLKNQLLQHLAVTYKGIVEMVSNISTSIVNNVIDYSNGLTDLYKAAPTGTSIKSLVYTGGSKSVVSPYKFDSDPERIFAIVCENSPEVKQWLRPNREQFNITYNRGKKYQPDFVVETSDKYYLVEVKGMDRINDPDVIAKKERAIQYCKLASEYNTAHKYKPFIYLFVPENQFDSTTTFNTIKDRFSNN
jgi:type III restriction enzyme